MEGTRLFFSSLISLHSLETGFSFCGGNCSQRWILQLFLTIAFYGKKKKIQAKSLPFAHEAKDSQHLFISFKLSPGVNIHQTHYFCSGPNLLSHSALEMNFRYSSK